MVDFFVEIAGPVSERSGIFDDGRGWLVREQSGYLFCPGAKYPYPISVRVQKEGFPLGKYLWKNPIEYYRGDLRVPRYFQLEPVKSAAASGATRP